MLILKGERAFTANIVEGKFHIAILDVLPFVWCLQYHEKKSSGETYS